MTKKEILQALARAGVAVLTIGYNGYGDEGCFHMTRCSDANDKEINISDALQDATECLLDDVLRMERGGWNNNDGAFGSVTIDVATGVTKFHHEVRVPEYDGFEVSLREGE